MGFLNLEFQRDPFSLGREAIVDCRKDTEGSEAVGGSLNLLHAYDIADLEAAGGDDLVDGELARSCHSNAGYLGCFGRGLFLLLREYPWRGGHDQDNGKELEKFASHVRTILREDDTNGEGEQFAGF